VDPPTITQAWLFALFAVLTAALDIVLAPTYNNLLVPMMQPSALFPALSSSGGGGFLATSASMSTYVLTNLVDPSIALVVVALGVLYLVRAGWGPIPRLTNLLPRLVVAVLLANFSLPVAGVVLGLAGATYPVVAGFDGGAWESWTNLTGPGLFAFSWDNGALAFVLAFAVFSLLLLLVLLVAVRNALLGVLLVLLPIFTLLWPIPSLAPLARRGWMWFAELAFLPVVMIVPLELAVGSPSSVLLVGYLVVALGSPALLALGAGSLTAAGAPSAGGTLVGGVQRGLSSLSSGLAVGARPILGSVAPGSSGAVAARRIGNALDRPFPGSVAATGATLLGHGAERLLQHVHRRGSSGSEERPSFRPIRGG
jgi:hypothetical protein